jgi:hypothetical protein
MRLSDKQKLIYSILNGFNPKASQAYLGALEVLEDGHRDKIHQSANSIRHALSLISRKGKQEPSKHKEKDGHKKKIRKLVDPLGGIPPQLDILIPQLIDKYHSWFVGVAHYAKFPTERQYRRKFAEMEELLLKIIRPHFDVISEIDKILANERPSMKSLKRLDELIARDMSSYDHFFQHVSDDWLPFLVKKGYFDNPTHIIEDGDGRRFGFISPSRYLARIAEARSAEVLRLILAHRIPQREERNPIILENFVMAAIKMPSKYARKIAYKVYKENWLDVLYFSRLSEFVSDLMVKLSNDGYHKDAISLAYLLFDMRLTEPVPVGGILEDYTMVRNIKTNMDDYRYKHYARSKLPILTKNDPASLVDLLVFLLNKSIRLEKKGRKSTESDYDGSVVWRPAIEDHEQNTDYDFRSVLIEILRDTLVNEGRQNISRLRKELRLLQSKPYPVFRRIELHIYRMFPKQFTREIEQAVIKYFDAWQLRHEYYHLIKKTFPLLSKKTKEKFLKTVENGPTEKTIRKWKENQKIYPNETVKLRKKIWLIDRLEPIAAFLDDDLKYQYEQTVKDIGTPHHPDFHTWHSVVHTAMPTTELADNLNPDEVIDFLKSYKVKKGSFLFYDGTKEKFQDYVEKNPLAFSKSATELKSADPLFSYAFFSGIENAAKADKEIDWKNVLLLCNYVVESINKGSYDQPAGYNILGATAGMLEEGLKSEKSSPPFDLRNDVWKLLSSLVPFGEEADSWEENYPDKNWDAIGISINTTSGKTFRAIFQYALWCDSNLKKDKPHFADEVRKILDDYLDKKLKNNISRHATVGEQLPNLIYFDKDWALKNLSKIFPPDNKLLARAAWDAYLYNNVLPWAFREVITYYKQHLNGLRNPTLVDGRLGGFDQRVVEHATIAYVYNLAGADDLFKELLGVKNDLVLQHSAWMVARVLKDYKESPNKSLDLDKIKNVWKSRLAEYGETGWWFISSPFSKEETLDLLLDVLRRTNGNMVEFLSTVQEEMISYAKEFPLKTAEVLELLLKSDKNKSEFYAVRGITTKNLLEALLKSKNKKAIDKTKSLIHYLGSLGFNEFMNLLKDD